MAAPVQITAPRTGPGAWFHVRETQAHSILSPTSGFIAQAGFTHSLNPARNCTYGCVYCYVPTMRLRAGLRPEDWQRWGQFTTFKTNTAELLRRSLRGHEVVYCSPLVDPYQPAEATQQLMPGVLATLARHPPKVFVIQTRGPLILRDLTALRELNHRTVLRVSFSITTDQEDIRRLYEPHCEPIGERLEAVKRLGEAGIATYTTLAPLLPCDPERLARLALEASELDVIGDPLHVRSAKRHGATTRDAAWKVSSKHGHLAWLEPAHQSDLVDRVREVVEAAGRRFGVGPEAFGWLSATG